MKLILLNEYWNESNIKSMCQVIGSQATEITIVMMDDKQVITTQPEYWVGSPNLSLLIRIRTG
jgi:hypothetical protein